MAVLQSNSVTPGHIATWATDGVIQDGGPIPTNVLASLRGANFNITGDQPILIPATVSAFSIAKIIITNASVNLTTAVGGFYPQSAQGGTPIVAASQTYTALTTINGLMLATLAAYGSSTRFSSNILGSIGGQLALYFNLTTAQGVSAVADIFVIGDNLS